MTPPTTDVRIVQLLFSRFCHDLAGPISAVSNGLELIAELPDGGDAELLDLIAQGTRAAALKLEFARLAFGFGGGSSGAYLGDAERLCKALFGNDQIEVAWRADTGGADLPKDVAKLLINMVLAGVEGLCAVGCGALSVTVESAPEGLHVRVTAEGPGAALKPAFFDALNGRTSPSDLDPAIAQGLFARSLAQLAGGTLAVDVGTADRVSLSTSVPHLGFDQPYLGGPALMHDPGRLDRPPATTDAV